MEPFLMKCPNKNVFLVYREDAYNAYAITHDTECVHTVVLPTAELESCGKEIEHRGGLLTIINRLLNPTWGEASVTPEAKLELENMMKKYTTKASARRALSKIGPDALAKENAFIFKVDDGYELDEDTADGYQQIIKATRALPAPVVKPASVRVSKTYTITTEDYSKRKGGFRLTLDAVAAGNSVAQDIYDYVLKTKPDYKRADIYTDLSMAARYGYVTAN